MLQHASVASPRPKAIAGAGYVHFDNVKRSWRSLCSPGCFGSEHRSTSLLICQRHCSRRPIALFSPGWLEPRPPYQHTGFCHKIFLQLLAPAARLDHGTFRSVAPCDLRPQVLNSPQTCLPPRAPEPHLNFVFFLCCLPGSATHALKFSRLNATRALVFCR